MFRLIPSIFGHAKSCWDIFKHQILFQRWLDAILCIAYYIFCTHTTSVTTFACLQEFSLCIASSALNYLLCVHRARMGAQSSAGRGLVNLRPRERIGQSYPAGKDARWIHPCRMEQIDSVKFNPSLVMMRECTVHWRCALLDGEVLGRPGAPPLGGQVRWGQQLTKLCSPTVI